jgi:NAD(P)-dependent dehydrogenase (short-subunit alcohol dehydrogenase family)
MRVSAARTTNRSEQPVAVVTGASSGIGLYTALGIARAGMRLVMAGRDRARTEAARRFVTYASGSDQVETALADFSRLAEVRRLAERVLSVHRRLDVLVNNAGLFSPKYRFSPDGFELTFAVNHLAPFLLTNLLLERLKASTPARIVTVASDAHHRNRIEIENLTRPRDWTMMKAYGRSKLCNILFTRELASRLDPHQVVAICLHPGMVATAIGQRGGLTELGWRLAKPFMLSPEKGAETPVFLATVPDPTPFHGGYVIRKALAQPDSVVFDSGLARRLWDESARLVGL